MHDNFAGYSNLGSQLFFLSGLKIQHSMPPPFFNVCGEKYAVIVIGLLL
jgi:hypothetical protein